MTGSPDLGAAQGSSGTPTTVDEQPRTALAAEAASKPPGARATFASVGRHAAVYAFGLLLSKAVSFIMLPVYTHVLTPTDYGVMALVEMTLDVLSILAGGQIALGIFRFYHKADTDRRRNQVVATALYGLGATFALMGAATMLAAEPLSRLVFGGPQHTQIIRLAGANLALQVYVNVALIYARVRDFSTVYVVANAAKLFLNLSLNIALLVWLDMGVVGVFISNLVATALVGGALLVWLVRTVGLAWSREAARDLVRYGGPLMAMWAATFIATFADRFFLQASADEATVGIYNLAYQFGFLLATVAVMPLEYVWAPRRFAVAKRPREQRDPLFADVFVYANAVLFAGALGITLFVGDFLRIMSPPTYWSAAELVPLILVAYVFQSWSGVQDIGVLVRERTGFMALANWIAAAVALVGYWLLIPRFLSWGAAVATVLAFFTRWALTYGFSQRLWPVRYRWGPVLRTSLLATAVALASLLLPALPLGPSVAAHAALFVAFLGLCWTLGGYSELDRSRAADGLRRGLAIVRSRTFGAATG